MPLEANVYLYDIYEAINRIATITDRKTFETYANDETIVWAVERGLSIIGEAVSQLTKSHPDIMLTSAKEIVGFRNILIHNYARVSQAVVWKILQENLPILKVKVENLLKQ
jgi:uncharacterized protein with HEPN domain